MPNFLRADPFYYNGIALLRLLTNYNKAQEGLQDKDVALIVCVETRKSGKFTILLGYYAQLKYLTAAAWLAFLILLSSVITAICGGIDPDNFHYLQQRQSEIREM
ncbi:hypothetical protein K435DRAFT_809719 [Dendrothele bispora CBS 962.96]|uniref:Uncharacterized protein n=1 Tax=Dendrothele bispora (strain CBS 962.96) TaxID=1314807 RepID=A0A4S8KXJ8_DENBC|nr:hypothetical protein K435DRAFT_809719 [Dendrothele bispora CBS 962.96]